MKIYFRLFLFIIFPIFANAMGIYPQPFYGKPFPTQEIKEFCYPSPFRLDSTRNFASGWNMGEAPAGIEQQNIETILYYLFIYRAVFRPDLPQNTQEINPLILTRVLAEKGLVTEIPGYPNLNQFWSQVSELFFQSNLNSIKIIKNVNSIQLVAPSASYGKHRKLAYSLIDKIEKGIPALVKIQKEDSIIQYFIFDRYSLSFGEDQVISLIQKPLFLSDLLESPHIIRFSINSGQFYFSQTDEPISLNVVFPTLEKQIIKERNLYCQSQNLSRSKK